MTPDRVHRPGVLLLTCILHPLLDVHALFAPSHAGTLYSGQQKNPGEPNSALYKRQQLQQGVIDLCESDAPLDIFTLA